MRFLERFFGTTKLKNNWTQENEYILQQDAYCRPTAACYKKEETQKCDVKWQFFRFYSKIENIKFICSIWICRVIKYLQSLLKSAIIVQIAAMMAANPRTKPTKIQMRAPRASMQPPLNCISPLIWNNRLQSLICPYDLMHQSIYLSLGDWINHD